MEIGNWLHACIKNLHIYQTGWMRECMRWKFQRILEAQNLHISGAKMSNLSKVVPFRNADKCKSFRILWHLHKQFWQIRCKNKLAKLGRCKYSGKTLANITRANRDWERIWTLLILNIFWNLRQIQRVEQTRELLEMILHLSRSRLCVFWRNLSAILEKSDMEGNEELVKQTRESLDSLRKYVAANVHPDKLK